MSQQPPHGQDPYQPWTPYSAGGYPNPYQAFPPRRDHTTRNILLAVGGVLLLGCGGLVALVVFSVARVGDSFDRTYPGSVTEALTVEEGEGFSIRGFTYDEGWSVTTTPQGNLEVGPLRVTNERRDEEAESVSLTFRLYQDDTLLDTVRCDGPASIPFGRSAALECTGFLAPEGAQVDEVEVYDNTYYDSEYRDD